MRTNRHSTKARIVGWSLADLAVDVVVPTVVTLVLTAAGSPTYLALATGGVLAGAKAALGRLADWRADAVGGSGGDDGRPRARWRCSGWPPPGRRTSSPRRSPG